MARDAAGPTRPADRLTLGHVGLIVMLTCVSMFEGFDVALTSVVMPYAGKDFHASPRMIGNALAVVGLGSIAAWLLIRLADRLGRRPVLLFAATGFSLCSLATLLAPSLPGYAAIQLVARLLMVTQVAMAYLILSETLPPRVRGRANGLLSAFASLGAALPYLLIGPALHSPLGWRALFLVGAAPLLALPFLWLWLRETPAFESARRAGITGVRARTEIRELTGPGLRLRFAAMGALWFILNFASGAGSLFFTLYVVQERQWAAGDLAQIAPLMLAGAFAGSLVSGAVMDFFGRRVALTVFLLLIGALAQLCYAAQDRALITAAWVGVQATFGVWMVAFTVNSELFPTHLRAAANGWCNSLIGRWGMVAAPAALGALSTRLGAIAPAAIVLTGLAYLAIPLVWAALPETRAARLEASP